MPAPKLFLGSSDISSILGVSVREAQNILQMFKMKGKTISIGRSLKVSCKEFAEYISKQDGSDSVDTYRMIREAIKTV